jgi:hypothetical protein
LDTKALEDDQCLLEGDLGCRFLLAASQDSAADLQGTAELRQIWPLPMLAQCVLKGDKCSLQAAIS